jgi:hypothetical protein
VAISLKSVQLRNRAEDKMRRIIYFLAISIVIAIAFIFLTGSIAFFLTPQIDYSGTSNGTVNFLGQNVTVTKIPIQTVSSLINGITALTSIIVSFTGAMIGIFRGVLKDDKKSNSLIILIFLSIGVPLTYLSVVYSFLAIGLLDLALRLSLIGLALALFVFLITILLMYSKLSLDNNEQGSSKPKEKGIRLSKTKITFAIEKEEGDKET